MFVELIDNKCEGLLHKSQFPGHYSFDPKTKTLKSHSEDEVFHLGKSLDVVVKHVDLVKKQIDLIFANDNWV